MRVTQKATMGNKTEDILEVPVFPTPEEIAATSEKAENGAGEEAKANVEAKAKAEEKVEQKAEEQKVEQKDPKAEEKKSPSDEPVVRSKEWFIQNRLAKKAEKTKEDPKKEDKGEEDEDEDLDPHDISTVEKVLEKKNFSRMEAIIQAQVFEKEVAETLKESPIAPYATPEELTRFRAYAQHPSRQEVPLNTILAEAIGVDRLLSIGAEIEREAAKKANASKV